MTNQSTISKRNQIVTELYNCPKLNECINKMEPAELRDDLKSMVIMIVMDKGEEFVIRLHSQNELSFYAIRLVVNLVMKNGSEFNKTYRVRRENSDANIDKKFIYHNAFEDVYESEEAHRIADQQINGRVYKEMSEEPVMNVLMRIKSLAYQDNPTYIHEIIESVGWYKQYMISLYMKLGNYELMAKETGVTKFSCFKAVRDGLNGLQRHFKLPVTKSDNSKRLSIKKCLTLVSQ